MKALKSTAIIISILTIATVAMAGTIHTTKSGYIFAISKQDLNTAMKYASDKDTGAFSRLMLQHRIAALKGGVRVYIEKRTWSGMVKIRPVGMTGSFWTVREAVR